MRLDLELSVMERSPVTLLWRGRDSAKHTDTGAHAQMQILVFRSSAADISI